jgi:NDP-sugar pyrophosphorylase family protein
MNKTAALILAGGRGKRMDILCHIRPKPALAVIEQVTEDMCLLPVRSNSANAGTCKISNHIRHGRETPNA